MANVERGTHLRRLARLLVMIQTNRYRPSYRELGRELGVSSRSARRYVKSLEEAGVTLPTGWGHGVRID